MIPAQHTTGNFLKQSNMNINLNINLTADPALLLALQNLAGLKTAPAKETPVKKLKEAPAANAGPGVTASTETTGQPAATSDPTGNTGGHTLEALRAIAVPKSKAGKKDVIKKWIADHGYPSLDSLQPVHFDEFNQFLATL